MSELQVRHIASMLKKSYSDKIDVSDCLTTKIEDKEALEPIHSRNIIKMQIIDNQILFEVHSKSKSF